jgi:hypothetical protein
LNHSGEEHTFEEHERSFSFDSTALDAVLDALWPASGVIVLDGVGFSTDEVGLSTTVHLYSAQTTETGKVRLRLRKKGATLKVKRETKSYSGESKLCTETRWLSGKDARRCLRDVGDVSAAFVKERLKLRYGIERHKVLLGIDRMTPFDPVTMAQGTPFHHLEIETPRLECLDGYARDVERRLSAVLRPLGDEDAKWRIARVAEASSVRLPELISDPEAWFERATALVRSSNGLMPLPPLSTMNDGR